MAHIDKKLLLLAITACSAVAVAFLALIIA
jgi:hypothetical protein